MAEGREEGGGVEGLETDLYHVKGVREQSSGDCTWWEERSEGERDIY